MKNCPTIKLGHLVFRSIQSNGGWNYLFVILKRNKNGDVRIVDIDDAAKGDPISKGLRRNLLKILSVTNYENGRGVTDRERQFFDAPKQMRLLRRLVTEGQPRGALLVFEELPPEFQNDRSLLWLKLQAVKLLGDNPEAHHEVLSDFIMTKPESCAIQLELYEYYAVTNQHELALKSIRRVINEIGSDAWLETHVAALHLSSGELRQARKIIDNAVQNEPKLFDAHLTRVEIAAAQSDFVEAIHSLNQADSINPIDNIWVLEELPELQPLIATAKYQAWKREHDRRINERSLFTFD